MQIKKRNGQLVNFNEDKIERAIGLALGESSETINWTDYECLLDTIKHNVTDGMGVEEISDLVEIELMRVGLYKTAKRYILYRDERSHERSRLGTRVYKYLSNEFLSKYKHKEPFKTEIGKFTYLRTYSRLLPKEGRRETWLETVARTVDYNVGLAKWKNENLARMEAEVLFDNIFNLRQFPSGRALFSAGEKPSYQNPISQFNCSFAVFDNFDIVKDAMYLLMLGVGFGFSVEEQYVDLLPKVRGDIQVIHKAFTPVQKSMRKESTEYNVTSDMMEIVVGDSKFGWASAVDILLKAHYSIEFAHVNFIIVNYNHVRPFNEPLKTFGGFASGHSALQTMITKIDKVLKKDNPSKKKLQPIDCMDIIDITAESIVVGGTRRSACSALMSESDMDMRNAKQKLYTQDDEGNWIIDQEITHRQMSNNSIAFWKKPSYDELKKQFEVIKQSAESNFFNMESAQKRMPNVKGTNPCGEILLDTNSFCNLVTLNCMAFVDEDGTLDRASMFEAQSMNARMSYRVTIPELELPKWNAMQKKYRLTGLSLTGYQDMVNATNMSLVEQKTLLQQLKQIAIESANLYADQLGLNRSELVTTVKPEGTLSLLPTVSSGLHMNHSDYYIRRIRINSQDPLCKTCESLGYPVFPEVGQDQDNPKTKVIEFPVKAPHGRTKYDVSAIEQLETYKMFMEEYVQHNASNTISVRSDKEWEEVVEWVYENWDIVIGITFISLDDSFYQLLPYESCSEDEYTIRKQKIKPITYSELAKHESFELFDDVVDESCSSGVCGVR